MRRAVLALVCAGLAACTPQPPDDGEAYFENITSEPSALAAENQRLNDAETISAAQLAIDSSGGGQTTTTAVPSSEPVSISVAAAQTAAASQPQAPAITATTDTTATATPAQPPVEVASESGTGISDTQDFGAITARETRQSDAAKLAALRASYKTVEPTELPRRPDGSVNLASYAISQKHPVGTRVYSRFNRSANNCARYRKDQDEAQRVFLRSGGPEKDRRQLDPDGDGFACDWDPETYRRLLRATQGG